MITDTMTSIRRRMRNLLRSTFSAPSSEEVCSTQEKLHPVDHLFCKDMQASDYTTVDDIQFRRRFSTILKTDGDSGLDNLTPRSMSKYRNIILKRNTKLVNKGMPEVYAGKTGLDLPVIYLEPMSREVYADFSGPDGGLTKVNVKKF